MSNEEDIEDTENNEVEKEELGLFKRKEAEEKRKKRTLGPYRKSSGSNDPNYDK